MTARDKSSRPPSQLTSPRARAATAATRASKTPAKYDVKRDRPDLYAPTNREFETLIVPRTNYLAVDGVGDPDAASFGTAIARLYALAYAVKFHSKNELARDYVVPPLEALWWSDDPTAFTAGRRDRWSWTVLSALPEWITLSIVDDVKTRASRKNPEVANVRLHALDEGTCFQMLHVGSFADEAPHLARLHNDIMPTAGVTFAGLHHEIYLSDARRTVPERRRTILRQPVVLISDRT